MLTPFRIFPALEITLEMKDKKDTEHAQQSTWNE